MKKIFLFTVLLLLLLINSFHEKYPDEFDSILGGRYIAEGKVIYRDWFQHHQPGAYVLAAVIYRYAGQSFVRFRISLAFYYFSYFLFLYYLFRKRLKTDVRFFVLFLLLLAVSMTYFWGHMLLADTLAAYFLIPAIAILSVKTLHREKLGPADIAIISASTFLTWFTSMTYIIVVFFLNVYAIWKYIQPLTFPDRERLKNWLGTLGVFALPYILFFGYFVLNGALKDYYFANITYNQNYYIYNYPRPPGTPVNPIRYSAVIVNDFINNYIPLVNGMMAFPLGDPLRMFLAVSGLFMIIIAFMEGHLAYGLTFLAIMVFSNSRSNPMKIRPTDYQASVYLVSMTLAAFIILNYLYYSFRNRKGYGFKYIIQAFLGVILLIYVVFTGLDMTYQFAHVFFPKYMGQMPLIYDRPVVAPVLNRFVKPDEYVFIGPFEFEELFYLKTRNQPTKYHWFLQHAAVSKIKDELMGDISLHKPLVIVFDRGYAPWGGDPHKFNYFMTDYLDREYFRIFTLNQQLGHEVYKWKIHGLNDRDLDGRMNFDLARKDEIIGRLIAAGIIEKTGN